MGELKYKKIIKLIIQIDILNIANSICFNLSALINQVYTLFLEEIKTKSINSILISIYKDKSIVNQKLNTLNNRRRLDESYVRNTYSIDIGVNSKIDDYCKENNYNKSALTEILLEKYIKENRGV